MKSIVLIIFFNVVLKMDQPSLVCDQHTHGKKYRRSTIRSRPGAGRSANARQRVKSDHAGARLEAGLDENAQTARCHRLQVLYRALHQVATRLVAPVYQQFTSASPIESRFAD